MFKKLLSNLPFNPGLLAQVSFYSKRLHREQAVRRIGFVFITLAFSVQLIAVLYPSQKSLAASPNDILDGITTKQSILNAWDANTGHIQEIYGKFGITRENIAAIPGANPNSSISSTGQDYWSIGRLPLSSFGISSTKWGDRTINANGTTVYQRPLHAWDSGGSSTYAAWQGTNKYGVKFWILKTCGNPTFVGSYLPTPPKPKLSVHKALLTPDTVHPGDTVKFRIEYQNSVPDSLATNLKVSDTLNSNFEYVSLSDVTNVIGNTFNIERSGQLGYSATPYVSTLTVKVKPTVTNHTLICNTAKISSVESSSSSPENPCINVVVNCSYPGKTNLSSSDLNCFPPCPSNPSVPSTSVSCGKCSSGTEKVGTNCVPVCSSGTTRQADGTCKAAPPTGYCIASATASGSNIFAVKTSAYVQGTTKITGYTYSLDGNPATTDATGETPHTKTFSGLNTGSHQLSVKALLANSTGQATQTADCPTQMIVSEARVNLSKTVTNITKGGSDANRTKVGNGDTVQFKLTTKNVTNTDYLNYNGNDYFGDVLQYADISDMAQLAQQGLTLDSGNHLTWTIANLKANTSDVKTINVKVKDTIPNTNRPSNVAGDYNCTISNDYGNQVTMNVGCPLIKTIESTTTGGSLPNTGPGTSITIGAVVTVIAGYLLARSRLLAKELDMVRSDYVVAGGY